MGIGCSRRGSTADIVAHNSNNRIQPSEFRFIITSRDPTPIFINNRNRPRTRDNDSNDEIILRALDSLFMNLLQARSHGLRAENREPFSDLILDDDLDYNCSICLENLSKNDEITTLGCNHIFHKNCIDNWFINHSTCPLCNLDFNN